MQYDIKMIQKSLTAVSPTSNMPTEKQDELDEQHDEHKHEDSSSIPTHQETGKHKSIPYTI